MMENSCVVAVVARLTDPFIDEFDLMDLVTDVAHTDLIHDFQVGAIIAELVSHRSPDVRAAAMRGLAFHGVTFDWDVEPGVSLLDRILVAARKDTDLDCRSAAVASLGTFFRGTCRSDVIRTLVAACRCSEELQEVRAFAYTSALKVLGVPGKEHPNPFSLTLTKEHFQKLDEIMIRLESGDWKSRLPLPLNANTRKNKG